MREKVVRRAGELFDRQGYGKTTMEDVAAHADVGVGTLYNHFGTKEGLLLAVFEDASEPLLAEAKSVVESPGSDAEASLVRLVEAFEPLATTFKKSVLRETLAAALVQPAARVEEFASLDARLAATIGELLVKLATTGAIAPEVDIEAAAIALYGAFTMPLLLFLSLEDMDRDALRSMVRRQVHIVFHGLSPRPRPPVSASPAPKLRRP